MRTILFVAEVRRATPSTYSLIIHMFFLRFIIFKLQEICLPDSLFGLQHVFTKNITKMGSLVLREPRKIGVVRTGVNLKSVHENRPNFFFA